MAYQVLARKWRPKRFQDVIGQKHITQSLQNILKREKIGQAYIFTGTRGIGKTSVARLFAKALRCLRPDAQGNPCNQCDCCADFESDSSMNVIEIDGASNNGVDNIRELINEVQFLPSVGKYKVYIIDEVHMVTTQAFNALLKTLEEPPAHVIFLFATTEPEKLMGTVLSRCQRFDFRHASVGDLTEHLKMIAEVEGIKYQSVELLRQIASEGKGSVRDTLSLLDQVLSFSFDNVITEEILVLSLGLARTSAIQQIVESLLAGNVEKLSLTYRSLISENVSVKNILSSLYDALFHLIDKADVHPSVATDLSMAELFWVYETLVRDGKWCLESIDPERVTEILLQKVTLRRTFFNKSNSPLVAETKKKVEPEVPLEIPVELSPIAEEQVVVEQFLESLPDSSFPIPQESAQAKDWSGFLAFLRTKSPLTCSYLEQGNILAPVNQQPNKLVVALGFDAASKTFYEYFDERESREKVVKFLAEYFTCSESSVELKLELIEQDDFVSRAVLEEQELNKRREQLKEQLVNHPLVSEAKRLFDGKIDRVILKEEMKEKKE